MCHIRGTRPHPHRQMQGKTVAEASSLRKVLGCEGSRLGHGRGNHNEVPCPWASRSWGERFWMVSSIGPSCRSVAGPCRFVGLSLHARESREWHQRAFEVMISTVILVELRLSPRIAASVFSGSECNHLGKNSSSCCLVTLFVLFLHITYTRHCTPQACTPSLWRSCCM